MDIPGTRTTACNAGARRYLCIAIGVAAITVGAAATRQTEGAEASRVSGTLHAHTRTGPLVFFQTFRANSIQRLRRVLRVDPRTGRRLVAVTLPSDARTFIDATEVGDTTFLAWASNRGDLWLAAAGRTGGMSRRWRVGRSAGFEVRPVPNDPTNEVAAGVVRVTADARYALLVNGRGARRIGRFVDLRSGTVHNRPLPRGVEREVADTAVLGHRFVLIGRTGGLVTLGPLGGLLARGQVGLPASGSGRIRFVDIVAPTTERVIVSFVTGSMFRGTARRSIAWYDASTGRFTTTRSYPDDDGYAFAATTTRFVVFGDNHWVAGRLDGGPLRKIAPLGPGARPPATSRIDPNVHGNAYVLGSTTSADGQAVVLRSIDYANPDDRTDYTAFEILDVDIRQARVLQRTRFADDAGGPPRHLPYALSIRVS